MEELRLQKYLSECGVMSRRRAEEEIEKGTVLVNGKRAVIGQKINPDYDYVEYRGKPVEKTTDLCYIMLNKPRGYVSTLSDEKGRDCVAALVKDIPFRVYPIGRLDLNSDGLLLFTNDGELTNKLLHPKNEVDKTYLVRIRGKATPEQLARLNRPMTIDGYRISPAKVTVSSDTGENQILQFVIHEGRNRQIRKMCEQVDLFVSRLKRISFGELELGTLKSGHWRLLTKEEIKYLKSL